MPQEIQNQTELTPASTMETERMRDAKKLADFLNGAGWDMHYFIFLIDLIRRTKTLMRDASAMEIERMRDAKKLADFLKDTGWDMHYFIFLIDLIRRTKTPMREPDVQHTIKNYISILLQEMQACSRS